MRKLGKYGLPLDVIYCSKCTRSNQRPHSVGEFNQTALDKKKYLTLDKKDHVCESCKFKDYKNQINWDERDKELKELCKKFRKNDGTFDVIVPGSGGKDSLVVAHQLKEKYGMHPLLITWAPNLTTSIGEKNFNAWINLGMQNYTVHQNQKVHRLLTRLAFLNLVHPFQPFIIGQKNLAPKLAETLNINFVMFGEHDAEFGMMMENKNNPKMDKSYFVSDKHYKDLYLSGYKVSNLMNDYRLSKFDLDSYLPIESTKFEKSKIEFHFFSYYSHWNFHDNYYYAVKNSEFKPSDLRLEGGYDKYASMDDKMDWLHFYTFFIKFGMGRASSATEQEIRSGAITRDEGISLIKRFDGEFPKLYLNDCLKYMNITKKQFNETIDKARPKHLWSKKGNKWQLKNPIWK